MDPPTLQASRPPFSSVTTLLSPHLPSSKVVPKQLSRLDRAVKVLHEWSTTLSAIEGVPASDLVDKFCANFIAEILSFRVNSASSFSPNSSTNRDATSPHGPRPRSSEGERVSAVIHSVKELLTGLNDRAKEGDWWYKVGIAISEGLTLHLDENDVGKKTPQDLAYRAFICHTVSEALVRIVVPDSDLLPKSSADDMAGLGRNTLEMATKYHAIEVLGDLLSKNEPNKAFLKNLFPPDYLGAILHAGWDHHLSHLTFELAFRLLPPKHSLQDRKAFLKQLFSEDVFGKGKDNLAKKLRDKMNRLDVSKDWEESYQTILKKISELHIRRSQFFETVSMRYDQQQLLAAKERASDTFQARPPPSTSQIVKEGYYETKLLWFSRHILAATITTRKDDSEDEENEERMVVPLEGIEKLYIEDLDHELEKASNLNCLRITCLVDPSYPLTVSSKPYPSEPSHVGSRLEGLSETQAIEHEAAGAGLKRFHHFEILVKRDEKITTLLIETLKDRGLQYPRLLDELSEFTHYFSRSRPSFAQTVLLPSAPQLRSAEASTTPAPQSSSAPEQHASPQDDRERRVTFANVTDQTQEDPKQKSSRTDQLPEGRHHSREEVVAEMDHDQSPSLAEKSKDTGEKEEEEGKNQSQNASQGHSKKRRDEVSSLAEIDAQNEGADASAMDDSEPNEQPFLSHSTPPKTDPQRVASAVTTPIQEAQERRLRKAKVDDQGKADESSELSALESDDNGVGEEPKLGAGREIEDSEKGKAGDKEQEKAQDQPQELLPPPKRVVSSYSTRAKPSATQSKKKAEVEKNSNARLGGDEEEEEEEDSNSSRPTRQLRSETPQASKKVVTATRSSTSNKVAAGRLVKPEKRGRSSSLEKGEEGIEETFGRNRDQDESEESDLDPPETIGRGGKRDTKKKVVKPPSNLKTSKPAPKRRKTSNTSTAAKGSGEETDYESYPTLESKKVAPAASTKYGKSKKSPAKIVGTMKKAGKGQKRRGKKKLEASETEDQDLSVAEDDDRGTTTTSRSARLASRKNKNVVPATDGIKDYDETSEKKGIEEEEEEEERDAAESARRSTKSKSTKVDPKKKVVSSETLPTTKGGTSPASKKKNKKRAATLQATPPPFDVQDSLKVAVKARAPPSVSETASNQPRKNFSELVKVPSIHEDVPIERPVDEDLGGFVEDFYQRDEEEPEHVQAHSPSGRIDAPSLSPVPHPAATDPSFADGAFATTSDQPVATGTGRKEARQPTVLVDDTPDPTPGQIEGPNEEDEIYLGNHKITSLRGQVESIRSDVEMDDYEPDQQEQELAGEQDGNYLEDEAEQQSSKEGEGSENLGVADDSGVHLNISNGRSAEDGAGEITCETQATMHIGRNQPQEPTLHPQLRPLPPQRRPEASRCFLVPHKSKAHPAAAASSQPVPPRVQPTQVQGSIKARPIAKSKPGLRQQHSTIRPSPKVASSSRGPPIQTASRQDRATTSSKLNQLGRVHQQQAPVTNPVRSNVSSTSRSRQVDSRSLPSKSRGRSEDRTRERSLTARRARGHGTPQFSTDLEDDDFDEDEEELYNSLVGFANLMTRKSRQRRLERQQHHDETKRRFEEPLVEFMNSAVDTTTAIIDRARALSITATDPNSVDGKNPTQKLLAAASAAAEGSDALWRELQRHLDTYEDGEASHIEAGAGGAGGSGAGDER